MAVNAKRRASEDPYIRCELHCHHDLGAGMKVSELLGSDGPYHTERPALVRGRPDRVIRHRVPTARRPRR